MNSYLKKALFLTIGALSCPSIFSMKKSGDSRDLSESGKLAEIVRKAKTEQAKNKKLENELQGSPKQYNIKDAGSQIIALKKALDQQKAHNALLVKTNTELVQEYNKHEITFKGIFDAMKGRATQEQNELVEKYNKREEEFQRKLAQDKAQLALDLKKAQDEQKRIKNKFEKLSQAICKENKELEVKLEPVAKVGLPIESSFQLRTLFKYKAFGANSYFVARPSKPKNLSDLD